MKTRTNYFAKTQASAAARRATQRKSHTSDAWFDAAVDPRFLEGLAKKNRA